MSVSKALDIAREHELDLVIISEQASPPVCKIVDHNKFQYEQKKREKEQQKKARESRVDTKEMQFRPMTGKGDIDIKIKKIKGFIDDGDKVRILVKFRGRELAHKENGFSICEYIMSCLGEIAEWETKPQFNANRLIGVLRVAKKQQ